MFNPLDARDLGRLRQSLTFSQKKWRVHLERRLGFMRQVTGHHFGPVEEATQDHVIFPLLGLALKIYSRMLSSRNPRAMVKHWDPEFDTACYELKLALDDEFERMDLAESLNAVTVESFFSIGVCKIGRVDHGEIETQTGFMNAVGSSFCDPILSEDLIFEMRCNRWKRIGYIGDFARVPLEWAKENRAFLPARKNLQASRAMDGASLSGSMRNLRSQLLSSGKNDAMETEYEDHVELLNLWLPQEGLILVTDRSVTNVLQVKEWDGPERGPYHILGYNWLPGNLCPLPPMAEWMDQHLLANTLANKTAEMAKNQKTVLGVTGPTGAKDGRTVAGADDMDVVQLDNPQNVHEFKFNGPDSQLWLMAQQVRELFNWNAGNVEALGGLGPQSGTVGQDRLLLESASAQAQNMQADVTNMTQRVMTDLAWHVRHDPLFQRRLVKEIEYANRRVPFVFEARNIPGEFQDYKIVLEPYSMQLRSPEQRLARLKQELKETVLPLQQFMQAQGIGINFEKLMKKVAELGDAPEFADMLIYQQGETDRPAGQRASKSPETTRRYIRENRPQSTMAGKSRIAMEMLAGGRPQPKEQSIMAR